MSFKRYDYESKIGVEEVGSKMLSKMKIEKALREVTGLQDIKLETPEREEYGDYSSNVAMTAFSKLQDPSFKLQTNLKSQTNSKHKILNTKYNSSRKLGEAIVDELRKDKELAKVVERIEVAGSGFINFWLARTVLASTMQEVIRQDKRYGRSNILKGKKYLIEHTSPNPNKAMHLGHLRNNVTGMAVANIWEFIGARVIRDCVDNNRGIALARLMWGFLKFAHKGNEIFGQEFDFSQKAMIDYWYNHKNEWHSAVEKGVRPDRFVDELYVKASEDFRSDKKVEREVRQIVIDWEAKEEKNWALWETVLKYSYQGQEMTLKRLGNKWDKIWREHEHYERGKDLVAEGLKKGVFKKGKEGAIVTNLKKYNIPDTVVIKSDGTALYITQDLALTKLKKETFRPDKLFWVVGPEQTLALRQLFAVCEQLGIAKYEDFVHISFGWMSIKGQGKMSSRLGNVIYIDDLLDLARDRIKGIIRKSAQTSLAEREIEEMAEDIGVGAVKYSILKVGRTTDTAFDFQESLDFQGNSGPYLQYTSARANSVLRKAEFSIFNFQFSNNLTIEQLNNEELSLLRSFVRFPEVIVDAGENYSPNLLCNYLYDLAQKFNFFYQKHRILDSDRREEISDKSAFRLALTQATGQILKNGLNLLGIQSPERM